jgi:hypothetical protein
LTNPADSLAYKPRHGRCEGFYRARVAAPGLELVGVLQGRLNFESDAQEVVTLTSPLVRGRSIGVRAQPIPVKTYYRMDGEIPAGGRFEWPIEDAILLKGLTAARLSVLGWYQADADTIYVPLRAAARLSRLANDGRIRLYLRPTADLDLVQYYWWVGKERAAGWIMVQQKARSGTPVAFTLPNSLRGLVGVRVSGRVSGTKDEWVDVVVFLDLGRGVP